MWQCHTLLKTPPLSLSIRSRLLTEVNRASVRLCRICCSATQVPPAPTSAVMTQDSTARSMPKVCSRPSSPAPPAPDRHPHHHHSSGLPVLAPTRMDGRVQVSERVLATDEPVIGKTKALMEGVEGVLSLAQGPHHILTAEHAITGRAACWQRLLNAGCSRLQATP